MAGKNKLKKFAQVAEFNNVFEPELKDIMEGGRDSGDFKPHPKKGEWVKEMFEQDQPLVVEFGCGRGEYSVGMGKQFPNKNFLGVDIKGARIWQGAKQAIDNGLKNVGFLRTRIEFISSFFMPNEVDEIWITFPDPQPQDRREKKRLTSERFIERYRKFLKPGGIVHLKTDNTGLFDYTLEQIQEHGYELLLSTHDLYGEMIESFDQDTQEILNIKTYYEELFASKGFKIKYCKFKIN